MVRPVAPPKAADDSSYIPFATRCARFAGQTDHWNKVLKVAEYGIRIGSRVAGYTGLDEVAEGIKNGRVVLLPSRSYSKFVSSVNEPPLPAGMSWTARESLRLTLFLLGGLYGLSFLEYTSKKGWLLGKQYENIVTARIWNARAVGVVGLTSGSLGMYSANAQAAYANEQAAAHRKDSCLVDAAGWDKQAASCDVAFWVAFYAFWQSAFEFSAGLLPDFGFKSRDLGLGLGFAGAASSFMKGWVATKAPRDRAARAV